MRNILLCSSALVGSVSALSPCQASDGIKLSVGGFFNAAYQVVFDDDGEGEPGNDRNTDGFFNDAEIHFTGKTTLDNGIGVGVHVELEGETDSEDQIDESWVFFEGNFGEVRFGSHSEALAAMCIVPPGGTSNFSAFSPNQWAANTETTNSVCTGVDGLGEAQKIIYFTPIFAGFQLGVSYTPNGEHETHNDGVGPHVGMPTHGDGESRHNFSVYAIYNYEGDGWGLSWGGGAGFEGHVEQHEGNANEEEEFYQTGLNLTFGNLSAGGVFQYYNDLHQVSGADAWVAGAGVSYAMDAWTFGAQYSYRKADLLFDADTGLLADDATTTFDTDDEDTAQQRAALTVNYDLGPGIALDAELAYTWISSDEDSDAFDKYDALEIGLGTAITF